MFCLNDTMRYFLCPGKTDMRKGINSLCGVVHDRMGYDVRLGDVQNDNTQRPYISDNDLLFHTQNPPILS